MTGGRFFAFTLSALAMLMAVSTAYAAGAQANGAPPAATHRVKRVQIIDSGGFEKPLAAYTMMLPVDWRPEGGVVWNQTQNCSGGGGFTLKFSATAPDGRAGMEFIPVANWAWSNFVPGGQIGACPAVQLKGAQDYLQYLVSQLRQGARVIDFRPRQDMAAPFKQFESATPMANGEMRSWVEAGEVLIAYNANGVEMRETISAVVMMNYSRMSDGMGGVMETITGSALPAFAMHAPRGELDFSFSEAVRKSLAETPEWGARIARYNAKMGQINVGGARSRSTTIAKNGSDILDKQMETWRKQSDSFDRVSRESSEAIRGVETYNDPYYGGTVDLDQTYDNAWQLDDGSYVLTNDTMFEPYRDLGLDGQRLEAAQ